MAGYSGRRPNTHFYPRPPRGGRRGMIWLPRPATHDFYPRPPRGGRPFRLPVDHYAIAISIHVLREEDDEMETGGYRIMRISIHVLREEDDGITPAQDARGYQFLSTSSARRTTDAFVNDKTNAKISIHVLREEDDRSRWGLPPRLRYFYPRPPRGGRHGSICGALGQWRFLSTSSARRTTQRQTAHPGRNADFYPRPPRGGRR